MSTPDPRVEDTVKDLVALFEEPGRLPALLERTMISRLAGGKPSDSWSISNQFIMMLNLTEDARTYAAWQKAGRQVRKGARGFDILAPVMRKYSRTQEDGTVDEGFFLSGFRAHRVFAVESTDIVDEGAWEVASKPPAPKSPPPLVDVAEALGLRVSYAGGNGQGSWGWYRPATKEVKLFTEHPSVFFHELAHAADERVQGGLVIAQDPAQEIVAEACAACLMLLYRDQVGADALSAVTWSRRYVSAYANGQEPGKAVMRLFTRIQKALALILGLANGNGSEVTA